MNKVITNPQNRGTHVISPGDSKRIEIRNDELSHFVISKLADVDIKVDFNSPESSSTTVYERISTALLEAVSNHQIGLATSNIAFNIGHTIVSGSETLTLEIFNTHATEDRTISVVSAVVGKGFDEDLKYKYTSLKQNTLNNITALFLDFTDVTTNADVELVVKINGVTSYLDYASILQLALLITDAIGEGDLDANMIPLVLGNEVNHIEYEVKSDEAPVFRYMVAEVSAKRIHQSAVAMHKRETKRIELIGQGDIQKVKLLQLNRMIPKVIS